MSLIGSTGPSYIARRTDPLKRDDLRPASMTRQSRCKSFTYLLSWYLLSDSLS